MALGRRRPGRGAETALMLPSTHATGVSPTRRQIRPTNGGEVFRSSAAFLLLVIATCVGCGDTRQQSTMPTVHQEAAQVRAIVSVFYDGYTHAEPRAVCKIFTPTLKRALVRALRDSNPDLHITSCIEAFSRFYARLAPQQQPPAAAESSDAEGAVTYPVIIRGRTAHVRFHDGGTWKLVKPAGRWLVAGLPIIPSSLSTFPRD
jgi:hypothetical protein